MKYTSALRIACSRSARGAPSLTLALSRGQQRNQPEINVREYGIVLGSGSEPLKRMKVVELVERLST